LGWQKDKEHQELLNTRSVPYRSRKDDELFQGSARYLVKDFEKKLEIAKQQDT
jgi:hypothetical protein